MSILSCALIPAHPYRMPPRLMLKASASRTYDWKALAACRSKLTMAQCGASCRCICVCCAIISFTVNEGPAHCRWWSLRSGSASALLANHSRVDLYQN